MNRFIGDDKEAGAIIAVLRKKPCANCGELRESVTLPDVRQNFAYDCGPSAVLAVLKLFGIDADEPTAIKAMGTTPEDGTQPTNIAKYLRSVGLQAKMTNGLEISDLVDATTAGKPVIVEIQDYEENPGDVYLENAGHYVVVTDVVEDASDATKGVVKFQDPNAGPREMSVAEFLKRWQDRDEDGEHVNLGIVVSGKSIMESVFAELLEGFTGIDAHGHKWQDGHQVKREEASGVTPHDAKLQGYAAAMKAKFGDKAGEQIEAMKAKVADDPAKVAALKKVAGMLAPHAELQAAAKSGDIGKVRSVLEKIKQQPKEEVAKIVAGLGYSTGPKPAMLKKLTEHAEGIAASVARTKQIPGAAGVVPDTFAAGLRSASLSPEQQKTYRETAASVITSLSPRAKERMEKHVSSVAFHPDPKSLGVTAKFQDDIMEGIKAGRLQIGGYYEPGQQKLALDGALQTIDTKGVYAHEISHAIDGPKNEISMSPEWQAAFRAEMADNQISKYGSRDPVEAFAEFGRLVYGDGVGLDQLTRKFPNATAVWKKHELIPESKRQAFKQPAELFDDKLPIDGGGHGDKLVKS